MRETPPPADAELPESFLATLGHLRDPLTPEEEERLARMEADTHRRYEQLVADSLDVDEAAEHLGVRRETVRRRLRERSLYGLEEGGTWRLPRFQFTDAGEVPHLRKLHPHVPDDLHPLAYAEFLARPSDALYLSDDEDAQALTPLQWISRGGSVDTVREILEFS